MSATNVHSRTARSGGVSDAGTLALSRARRRLASARSVSEKLHLAIPRVLCPSCGELMRLSRIDPSCDGGRKGQTTIFECSCGDDYRQTIRERV
jgi:RNase P subunit RPR2